MGEIEIEVLIYIAVGILSTVLFLIAFTAYRRDRRRKLFFVALAFFFFALKGFLPILDEIFHSRLEPFELISELLDFIILAMFFLGLLKE